MGAVIRVLTKVLVKKFYERNVGLLFFVFYLMFGVVESNQLINYHRSLIYGVLDSPIFLVGVMGAWVLYALKYLQLILAELVQPHNQFLIDYSRLTRTQQFWPMLLSIVLIYEPVLIYSVFIIFIGFSSKQYWPTIEVIIFHIGVLTTSTIIILNRINSLYERKQLIIFPALRWPWKKTFPLFYLNHLTGQLPLALLFTKVFSLFAIIGFMQITTDHYENRTALMGLLFGLMAHSVIIFEWRKLEDQYLLFAKGLPVSMAQRFFYLCVMYGVLLLPELVLLTVNKIVLLDLLFIFMFAIGYLVYQHTRLYQHSLDMDKHTTHTFGLFLISFMLVLFKLYWLEAAALLAIGYYKYQKDYYNFEASAN
jgi:hypothetical protein